MNEAVAELVPAGGTATFGAINTCAGGSGGSFLGITLGKANPCTIHAGTYYDSHDTTNNNQDYSVSALATGGQGDNQVQISNTGDNNSITVTDGGAVADAFAYARETNALADARVNVAQQGVFAAGIRNANLVDAISARETTFLQSQGRNQNTLVNSTLGAFFKSQTAESTQLLDSVIKFGFPIAVAGVLGYFYLKG